MKRVVLFGIGANYNTFVKYADLSGIEIVSLIDTHRAGETVDGRIVDEPEAVMSLEFDEIFVLPRISDEITRFLADDCHIEKNRIRTVEYINREVMLRSFEKYRFVMLTLDMFFLNFPYMGLLDRDDFTMGSMLAQDDPLVLGEEEKTVDAGNTVFIVRDHCYRKHGHLGLYDYLKKKYTGSRWVIVLSDMCDGEFGRKAVYGDSYIDEIKRSFEKVITYHSGDADKYGLIRYEQAYPNVSVKNREEYDVLFVGNKKNRLDTILKTFGILNDRGVRCRFWINGVSDDEMVEIPGITYNVFLPYEKYLDEIARCRCILEICQLGNETTYRYDEAVLNNKKLLVNDPSVRSRKYFRPDYVQLFDDPVDIDTDWIKDPLRVDYGYSGDYSPELFLDFIEGLLA